MRRVVVALAGVAIGCVAVEAWRQAWPPATETIGSRASQPPQVEKSPALSPQPRLTGTDWEQTFRRMEQRQAAAAESRAVIKVRGRVTDESGDTVGHARAYGVLGGSPEPIELFDVGVAADGTFEAEFSLARLEGDVPVTIGARAPGWLRVARAVDMHGGPVIDVGDLLLGPGRRLSGVVVTKLGVPVAELAIRAVTTVVPPVVSSRTMDTRIKVLARVEDTYYEGDTLTDRTGAFRIDGLGPGTYSVFSTSQRWFLETGQRFQVGSEDLRVIAVPAVSAIVEVRDAETGDPVPRLSVEIQVSPEDANLPRYVTAASGTGGRVEVIWPAHGSELERGCTVTCAVTAPGYLPQSGGLAAGATVNDAAFCGLFRLKKAPSGSLRVRVADSLGQNYSGELIANLVSSAARDFGVVGVPLAGVAPGEHVAEVPAGAWFLRMYPNTPLGRLVGFSSEANIPAAGEAEVRGSLLPFGSVRFVATGKLGPTPWSGVARGARVPTHGDVIASFVVRSPLRVMDAVPTGSWEFQVYGEDKGVWVGRVVVEHGVQVDCVLSRP